MAELRFAPEADQFLSSLESDLPRSEILLGAETLINIGAVGMPVGPARAIHRESAMAP